MKRSAHSLRIPPGAGKDFGLNLIFVFVIWIWICWVGSYLDIALNLSTSSWLSVDSPLFSREPWLLEKFLLEKWRAGANLERVRSTTLFEGDLLYLLPPLSKIHLPNRVIEVNISERLKMRYLTRTQQFNAVSSFLVEWIAWRPPIPPGEKHVKNQYLYTDSYSQEFLHGPY